MHPANTALSPIDLGTPALRWPEMERVSISLASPDEQGAVAYYFDTLAEASEIDNIELVGRVGKATCEYLMGLVRAKGLQLVRGPFLTTAPDHGPLPDHWWMIRAIVWVEEFDLVVPDEPQPETQPIFAVQVNGKIHTTISSQLTYRHVCDLASIGSALSPTVTYRWRGHPGGILAPGGLVDIPQRGASFDVAVTSGA